MKYIIKAPLHVSGIWIPVIVDDLRSSGSLGAGLNLALYVVLRDYSVDGGCSIDVNGSKVLLDHANYICSKAGVFLKASFESPVDIGRGYAVSAATTLSYSVLSGLLKGGFLEEYVSYAHEAEIIYRTGLGDVSAIYHGGLEVRVKPGAPGYGVVKHVIVEEEPCIVACILPGGEDTPSMLSRISSETYSYGEKLLEELIGDPSLESFFDKAQSFTRRIFSYSLIDEFLKKIRKGIAGYYRKKQALIIWVEEEYLEDITSYLSENKLYCLKTSIDHNGLQIKYST